MNELIRNQARAAYVPPTPEQLAAGADLVARWADNWNEPNPDSNYFRNLMHPNTRNQIPPMTAPADREGVVAHFSEVLRRLPDLRIRSSAGPRRLIACSLSGSQRQRSEAKCWNGPASIGFTSEVTARTKHAFTGIPGSWTSE